jgi:tetratricopeptide (TPR) repeat protein
MKKKMPESKRSTILLGVLGAATVALVGVAAYFAGWSAEAKYEDLHTDRTPSPEVQLEEQGRYDEAIQTVLNERRDGLPEAGIYSEVGQIYLKRAKKDPANREKWAQEAATYLDKAAASAPRDPFTLENAMDGFNRVGDYSEKGCPDYEKAVGFGEAALALLQGNTLTVEGHSRSYPTQPIKEGIEPRLKRIREKVEAWCRNTP